MDAKLPPIFCISLARDAKRRKNMVSRLDTMGVGYEIVDAVDGKALDVLQLGNRLRQDKMRHKESRNLILSEIGCYMSHCDVLSLIVSRNIPAAIILEDDASFAPDFIDVASAAAAIQYEWDMIILHTYPKFGIGNILCKIGVSHFMCRMKKRHVGTAGYLISRAGAQKLLDKCYEISEPVDVAFSAYWNSGIKYYAVYPRIVIIGDSPSNIMDFKQSTLKNPTLLEWWDSKTWRLGESIKRRIYDFRNPLSRERRTE